MDEYNPSTRSTSNNARGQKRRIGSSKRSSFDSDAEEPIKIPRKVTAVKNPDPPASCLPTLPGTGVFFENQKAGSKGMRVKIQKSMLSGEVLQVSDGDYRTFYESTKNNDPNLIYTNEIMKRYERNSVYHAWTLLTDCNLLLYGLGSKKKLIQNLVDNWLDGEDVIEIDGSGSAGSSSNQGEKYIKALMGHINKTILKNKGGLDACTINLVQQATLLTELLNIHYGHSGSSSSLDTARPSKSDLSVASNITGPKQTAEADSSGARRPSRQSVQDQERWGGRYALAKSKLFLVVQNICGDALSSSLSQQCLSLLASCKSVTVLATVENLNSIAHWDRRVLSRYRWSYHHTPTFEHARIPFNSFPLISNEMNGEIEIEAPEAEEQEVPLAATEVNIKDDPQTDDYFMTQADPVQQKLTKPPAKPAKAFSSSASASASSHHKAESVILSPRGKASKANGSAPQLAATAEMAPSRAALSLAAIKQSVTANHNSILEALVKAIQEKTARLEAKRQAETQSSSSRNRVSNAVRPQHESGVPLKAFYKDLSGRMMVKSEAMLRDLLKEFIDHGVIGCSVPTGQSEQFVYFKFPYDAHLQNNLVQKVMSVIKK